MKVVLFIFLLMQTCQFPAAALEAGIHAMLRDSPLSWESEVEFELEQLGAAAIRRSFLPSVYLSAPEGYHISIPPEGRHRSHYRIGISGMLPFGVSADISAAHALEYLDGAEDPFGIIRTGFLQTVSIHSSLTVPLLFTAGGRITSSADTAFQQALINYEIERNTLVRRFVADWFILYRLKLSAGMHQLSYDLALQAEKAAGQQIEQGTAALHELWDAQRRATSAELQFLEAETELEGKKNLFFLYYGQDFPEQPEIPEQPINWVLCDVLPRIPLELVSADLRMEEHKLTYKKQRQDASPVLSIGLSVSGPQATEAKPFHKSLADQFSGIDDWTAGLTLGVSLSTQDLLNVSDRRVQYEQSLKLLNLQKNRMISELLGQKDQLNRMLARYQEVFRREEQSALQIQQYLKDMIDLQLRGEIELLDLQETMLQYEHARMLTEITASHVRETAIMLELLGGIE